MLSSIGRALWLTCVRLSWSGSDKLFCSLSSGPPQTYLELSEDLLAVRCATFDHVSAHFRHQRLWPRWPPYLLRCCWQPGRGGEGHQRPVRTSRPHCSALSSRSTGKRFGSGLWACREWSGRPAASSGALSHRVALTPGAASPPGLNCGLFWLENNWA